MSTVSNLSFLSKVIEKVISNRILGHILDNNIVDSFQSAYWAGHSCETALLRVYTDIVTTVGKYNGSFLVLLDLSAVFDTIDHDNVCGCHRAQFQGPMNFVCICFHLVRYLDTILLAITSTRMTPNSTFHLSVRILWNIDNVKHVHF